MPSDRPESDLDLEIDEDFQRKSWAWQRVAWLAMAASLLLALLGLFGDGWLGHARTASDSGALKADYNRFGRRLSEMSVALELAPVGGEIRLWIDRDYAESGGLSDFDPPPTRSIAGLQGTTHLFEASPEDDRNIVTLRFQPRRAGLLRGELRMNESQRIRLSHFIYP